MGGGAGRATYNIAKELSSQGHQVDVLTSRLAHQAKQEDISEFRVYRVTSWRKNIHDCGFRGAFSFVLFSIPRFYKLTRNNNYDVVHYFFGLPTGFLSLLPGRQSKIPYVLSLRGSDVPHYDLHNKVLQRMHQLLLPITRRIWSRAKNVVALSESLRLTAKITAPGQHISVIANGVETEIFKQQKSDEQSKGVFRLITVSRLIERKGIQHILHALSQLEHKDITLEIIGTGNYQQSLKKLSKELSLDNQVSFIGYCPREKLPEYLSAADAFILPSMAESFGMVFVEAMACGLPIIAAETGGIPDYVHAENGILVRPGNLEDIKAAIVRIKSNQSLRVSMSVANRNKVVCDYSWHKVAENYLAAYQA